MSFDLDVLRGWRETIHPDLNRAHRVPPLARLHGPRDTVVEIHGVDVYAGRFHPQHGPVDLYIDGLVDHELYRISAPHVRFSLDEDTEEWKVRHLSPAATTLINGEPLVDTRAWADIRDGDTLRLGVVDFVFRRSGTSLAAWKEAQKALLLSVETPSLFLMRAGSACGPFFQLDTSGKKALIGRSFPDVIHSDRQRRLKRPDWDLAGLLDEERKYIGFRHVEIWRETDTDNWFLNPLSPRQRTYVNRVEVSGLTPLMPSDELGLGSVLFHFHHPSNIRLLVDRRTVELPAIVNWREEKAMRERKVRGDT